MAVRITFFLLLVFQLAGCVHRNAMSDPKLAPLWRGKPMPDQVIAQAKKDWPNESTLLNLQESTAILRTASLEKAQVDRAKSYLEEAYNTFEDLRDPENFSKAFTQDDQTPFRGKPYERMLAAILLALLDASNDRCDMAIPALRAAEFLDARWQPFQFGTDAPLVYALNLRCLKQIQASEADVQRKFTHPEIGVITIDRCIASYAWHSRHHVAHITSLRERKGWK